MEKRNAEAVNKTLPVNQTYTLNDEQKPTEREIVSALAGELMSTAIQVSAEWPDLGVEVSYNAAADYVLVQASFPDVLIIDQHIWLHVDETTEQLRKMIKFVGELGEVS